MAKNRLKIIKDDKKRTYEICGQTSDDSLFTNNTFAMQQADMEVSCTTPEVGTQQISDVIILAIRRKMVYSKGYILNMRESVLRH